MAKIKENIPSKTDEEFLAEFTTEELHNFYAGHNCSPGEECNCKFCEEYKKDY